MCIRSEKPVISALLRAPLKIPDIEKVKQTFQNLGYTKSVTRISCTGSKLTIRTKIQTLGVFDVAEVADRLRAKDVSVAFSRTGLVLSLAY